MGHTPVAPNCAAARPAAAVRVPSPCQMHGPADGRRCVPATLRRSIPRTVLDFERMWKGEVRRRLRGLKVLVIDEVSMISGEAWGLA